MNDAEEQVMQDLVCGDRTEADPEVQALFARFPECRGRYQRMMQLAGRLDEIGADRNPIRSVDDVEGPTVIGRVPSRAKLGYALLAAAALVVVAFLSLRESEGSSPPRTDVAKDAEPLPVAGADTKLGSTSTEDGTLSVQRSSDQARVEAVRWEWSKPLRAGWYTVVTIWGGADHSLPLVEVEAEDEETEWVAGSQDLAAMASTPPTRVTVHAVRADGRRADQKLSVDF